MLGESLERERRVSEIERKINELRQKYGMSFDEFFDAVESFSKLKRLMEKYDLDEILEDSLVWESLEDDLRELQSEEAVTDA
ncbi:hypothetical protein [Archaeoglobus neptunius]|uniref:hypothetical protein n=1 Tax=Archaeoglobus neptunius TaxID=2798580 RepID=UPI001925FAC6|nr:hypothetical protein [Archaeoglobus neptunius]